MSSFLIPESTEDRTRFSTRGQQRGRGRGRLYRRRVPLDFQRQSRAGAFIPDGPPLAQSVFKTATCLAYARGIAISDAIDFGTEQARHDDPDFAPFYDVGLLTLDSS